MARPRSEEKDSADASPSSPRRGRRWRRLVSVFLLATSAALAAGWFTRVWIVNTLLARLSGEWRVTVERVDPSAGGLSLSGVVVSRAGRTDPVFTAARVVSTAGVQELRAGNLGDLTLEKPVFRWDARESSREPEEDVREQTAPDVDAPPAGSGAPLVSWRTLTIRDGALSVRVVSGGGKEAGPDGKPEKGPGFLLVEAGLDATGGGGKVFRDGAVWTEAQSLNLRNLNLELLPEASSTKTIRLSAPEVTATAALDATTRTLEVAKVEASRPVLSLEGRRPEDSPPEPRRSGKRPWLLGVEVLAWRVTDLTFSGRWPFAKDAPPFSISSGMNFEGGGLRWSAREGLRAGRFKLVATNFEAPEMFTAGALEVEAVLSPDSLRVSRLVLKDGVFSDPLELALRVGVPAGSVPPLLRARLRADAELKDWTFRDDGEARSSAPQTLVLRDAEAALEDESALRFGALRLEVVPDEALAARRLRLLEIDQPSVSWNGGPEALAVFQSPEPRDAEVVENAEPPGEKPLWWNWTADVLSVKDGRLRVVLPRAGNAVFSAGLSVVTGRPESGGPSWLVEIANPRLDHPAAEERAPWRADGLKIKVSPEALWGARRIESAELAGSRLEIGEAFFRMLDREPAEGETAEEPPAGSEVATAEGPPASGGDGPGWRLGEFILRDTVVWLDDLGDGRRLEIPVARQVFKDLPLTPEGLAAFDRVYQVEAPNITLYSPWVEGQKVAVLDGNYVRFSPSGILKRRLERVDLMSPSLYAGQPLFDYIDAARKRFQTLAAGPPSPDSETPKNGESPDAGEGQNAGWHIPFYISSGKVIVAPKGNPWPDIPVFPFRNARGKDGNPVPFLLHGEEFHGELAVAPGWYEFPQYKLRVRLSDKGRIVFNRPVKNRDNNLVEVFEDNTVIYRQLVIDKVWLSITYDRAGIYARFGGATCGGYINGQVNLYLDELYTWDGFVSFSKIDMKPLTDKLTPDYVRMDGVIDDLTLRAWGDIGRLYQTMGTLKVSRPGRLEILALDAFQGKLSEMEAGISRQLGEIGVETLRAFDFTECGGDLRFYGSEGRADLRLSGPAGSRNFSFNLRDYRARLPKALLRF